MVQAGARASHGAKDERRFMEIQQLRYFITVVESGSLSRAAAALHLSQPALSQQMRSLEHNLRSQLLDRSSRGVRPTATGRALYRDAFRLVREFDQLATSVNTINDVRGVVSVGLPSGAAKILATPLVSRNLLAHPGIRLELFDSMSGYIRELFSNGRMDIALFYETSVTINGGHCTDIAPHTVHTRTTTDYPDAGHDVTHIPVYEEELLVFGSVCSTVKNGEVSIADLAPLPLVAPGIRSGLRVLIEDAFRVHGYRPRIVAELESLPTMIDVVRTGSAYAVLPVSAATEVGLPGYRVTGTGLRRRAVLHVSRTRSTSPEALDAVVGMLTSVIAEATVNSATTGLSPVGE